MPRIKIEIDGALVDLPEKITSLKMTFALKDRSGITGNTGARSEYAFTLPATKTNDQIFKRFWNPAEINEEEQKFRRASIEVGGLPYLQGKSQLTSATGRGNIYGRAGDAYKVAFYGNNVDWIADLREARLYTLPFSTHTFDNGTVLAGFNKNYPLDDYAYTFIKLKDWSFPDKVQLLEASPIIAFASIIDYIFDGLGYSVNSNFFSLAFFQRLYLPLLLPEKLGPDYSEDYLNVKGEALNLDITTIDPLLPINFIQTEAPAVGPNPYAAGLYTVPTDGFYRTRVRANIFNITNFLGLEIVVTLIRGGLNIPLRRVGDPAFNAYSADQDLSIEFVDQFIAGDQIAVFVEYTILGDADLNIFLEIDGEAKVEAGSLIDFKYIIPKDWKVLDFLAGISHAFNLVWQTNVLTREIVVEPQDSYKHAAKSPQTETIEEGFYTNNFLDFTRKIDLDKKSDVKNIIDRGEAVRLAWQYEGATEEAINNGEDLGFFAARYVMPEGRFNKAEEVLENPFFAATLCIFDEAIKADTSPSSPQIPVIWNGNYLEDSTSSEAVTEIKPRILYKEPYIALAGRAFIRLDNGVGGFNDILSPLCYMVNYNETTSINMPLSFANVTTNGINQVGLLERFYLQAFKRLETGKEPEEAIFWELTDIQNLDFRRKLFINDAAYILTEVNAYDVLTQSSTKTYLLYDSRLREGDEDKIQSSLILNKLP